MTREQLDAIRKNVDFNDVSIHDVIPLLAEVEGMRESCTGLVKQNERQYDEVLRLTAERDAAFSHGVAAMRAAAVAVASKRANLPKHSDLDSAWCRSAECILDELRHLPNPEDKP